MTRGASIAGLARAGDRARIVRIAIAIVAGALGLAGCAPPDRGPRFRAAGATAPRDGGTLRFAVLAGVSTLDPTFGYDEVSDFALHALFDTLVDFAPDDLHLIPRLAERWEVSPDGLTYTFWLRPGMTFSDGAPITAAHFKFSLERALATADSPFAAYLTDLDGAPAVIRHAAAGCAGIDADDDRRLVLRLTRRNPAFLAILAMPYATPQRAAHVAAAGAQLRRMPDATGPFELAWWDEGTELVLRRNPRYGAPGRAHLDAIDMRENIPRDTQFQMFERGELDTAEKLAAPDYLYVMSEPAWRPYVHRATLMNTFGARMNVTRPPFNDRRVRQALNYALDKSHSARLLNGTATPAHGMLPPGMPGYDPDLAPYPHDVAKARALLAEAGYPAGLELSYVTVGDEETEKLAGSLQSDLAEAGVQVQISVVAWTTYPTAIGAPDGPAFSFATWVADFPDPINLLEPKFHSRSISAEASSNDSFYANPALDAVLDAAHEELDLERRAALYRRAERILYDDAPWIWDYHRVMTEVTQPYVRGAAPHPIWMRDYTSTWLDLGPDGAPVPR
jgi:oligopeptide transport system substrate-binding protein